MLMTNGDKMVTDTKYCDINFDLQDYKFKDDFTILVFQGYDLILEIDWIKQFRSMQVDSLEK
jgi:Retroviral aspartyl protease